MKVRDSYPVSGPAIAGGAAAMRDQDWLREHVGRIVRTRERVRPELEKLGFSVWPSQANFLLARVPAGRDAEEVFQALVDRKILVRYFKLPRLEDCLRISIGTDEEMDAVLAALREIV